ncbi:hypothetical protein ABPG75_002236 [Micractinium tetrahymenae]
MAPPAVHLGETAAVPRCVRRGGGCCSGHDPAKHVSSPPTSRACRRLASVLPVCIRDSREPPVSVDQHRSSSAMSRRSASKPVCLHYLRGCCTRGSACWFAHDASRAGEVPLCTFYARGHCNRGDSCLYRHVAADARATAAVTVPSAAAASMPQRRQQDPQPRQQQAAAAVAGAAAAAQEAQPQQGPAQPPQPQLSRQQKRKLKQKEKKAQQRQAGQAGQRGAGASRPPQRPLCVLRFPSPEEQDALMVLGEYWEAFNENEPLFEELPPDAPVSAPAGAAGASPPAADAAAGQEQAAQPAAGAAREQEQEQAGKEEGSEEEESDEEKEGGELGRRLRAARAAAARGDPPPPPPPRYCEERMLVVAEEFAGMCWCEPCKRSFRDPSALLSHTTHSHAGSEKIAQLKALRACPCSRTFPNVSQLSTHIRSEHSGLGAPPGGMTEELLEGEAIADALFAQALMGGLLGGGGGYDSEDSEEGGMLGFSADEVYELACQGVKPWDPKAWDVLDVLNGGDYY